MSSAFDPFDFPRSTTHSTLPPPAPMPTISPCTLHGVCSLKPTCASYEACRVEAAQALEREQARQGELVRDLRAAVRRRTTRIVLQWLGRVAVGVLAGALVLFGLAAAALSAASFAVVAGWWTP